jgi:hypothetical protein
MKVGKVQFWHCKKQNGDLPNCNIEDIYDLCGQAVKSVNWANRGLSKKQMYDLSSIISAKIILGYML